MSENNCKNLSLYDLHLREIKKTVRQRLKIISVPDKWEYIKISPCVSSPKETSFINKTGIVFNGLFYYKEEKCYKIIGLEHNRGVLPFLSVDMPFKHVKRSLNISEELPDNVK